ncbi:heavy-metal-associated domain-containing protein [Reinekea blandensis]|uniref:Heavy metal transport/detoxification protein n=1 Tax=Reinekea blandensis MED297 TaxID=314283 RepID=A4BCQ1_9GAMM|nr:heavy metal-associated domain-containing protein [Reinekea blandensis]EAR09983.1 Heavy metal transport/detoxification protein [Reinekea sp. MED297] [Reinekea blandensis MED297]
MLTLKVDGATCGGCVKSIEKAVSQVAGVESVSFDLDTKLAQVDGQADKAQVVDAIEMAGFDVVGDGDE